jgi:5-methylcytosine-specific restriction enzyme subunit McrC
MPSGAGRNARLVLDARYKVADDPSRGDIAQVVAYVEAKGCRDAVLIYPVALPVPLDETVGEIRAWSMTFAIDGDLEEAGQQFLDVLASG